MPVERFLVMPVAALLCAMSAACGQYSWPDRPVKVPTRALQVHEDAFLASPAGSPGDPCAASALDLTLSGCRDACGPVGVSRDGDAFVTLLSPSPPERAPVPDWARPRYTTPPHDDSREHAAVPLGGSAHTVAVTSSCGLRVQEPAPGVDVHAQPGAVALTVRDACRRVPVTMVCQ